MSSRLNTMASFLSRPIYLFGKLFLRCNSVLPEPAVAAQPVVANNIRHLIWDMTWYGLLIGTTINFMQVYVVRLNAPGLLVAAVTYGPALVSALWQLPATRFINRTRRRMRLVLVSCLLTRSAFMVVALLPFLTVTRRAELTALVLVLQAFPNVLAMTSFLSVMADAVPAERISYLISWRMAGFGITSTLGGVLASQLLGRLPFPFNYQLLFTIGYAASLISQWHLTQLYVPDRAPLQTQTTPWCQDLRRVLACGRFTRFATAASLLQVTFGMLAPLLPLFWVRRLGASDTQISMIVTVYSGTMVFGSLWLRQAVRRIGRERVLTAGAACYAAYPLLVSLTPSVWWLIPWAALGGLFYSAVSVTLFDNLVAVSDASERTNFIAIYNLMSNLSLFAGPLIGGFIARGPAGSRPGLQVAAGLALVSGLLFARWLRPVVAGSRASKPAT